ASVSEAGELVRYGMRTASRLPALTARAARKATVAESTPPDSPTTILEKPVCSIWEEMKATMRSALVAGAISGRGRSLAGTDLALTRARPRVPARRPARGPAQAPAARHSRHPNRGPAG